MTWLQPIGGYCERLAPGFGAEPLNLITGLAFLAAGALAYTRAPGPEDRHAALALTMVGPAAALHHGFAVLLTLWVDILANQLYLLFLGILMLRRLAGAGRIASFLGAAAVLAVVWAVMNAPILQHLIGQPVDLFLLLFTVLLATALAVRARHPDTARGIAGAALLLAAGLPFRFLDAAWCPSWPYGTHAIWHLVNAASCFLLLATLARHPAAASRLAKGGAQG